MFKKFLTITTLKEIHFCLVNLDDKEISKINGQNRTVEKVSIIQHNKNNSFSFS